MMIFFRSSRPFKDNTVEKLEVASDEELHEDLSDPQGQLRDRHGAFVRSVVDSAVITTDSLEDAVRSAVRHTEQKLVSRVGEAQMRRLIDMMGSGAPLSLAKMQMEHASGSASTYGEARIDQKLKRLERRLPPRSVGGQEPGS